MLCYSKKNIPINAIGSTIVTKQIAQTKDKFYKHVVT